MTWTFVALGIAFVIMLFGFLTGRSLPEKSKAARIRKFSAIATVPLILTLAFPRPYVEKPYNSPRPPLTESEVSGRPPIEQARDIHRLQDEVYKLRTDLAEVNDHYGQLSQTALIIAVVFFLTYSFRKNEEAEEVDRTPLGLNDDDKQ